MSKRYRNKDLSPGERAKELLMEMSLEEKLGQVVCIWPKPETSPDILEDYPQGAGVVSATNARTLDSPAKVAAFQRKWQQAVLDKSEHHIPAIFHLEGLCGALLEDAVSFPTGIGRGSSWDPELEKEIGRIVSRQTGAVGVTHVLAPVLDVSRDSRIGRQGETYGEDQTLISSLGTAYVEGIQEQEVNGLHMEAVAKHFLGFHASMGGVQSAHCEIGDRTLRETYAKPFQAAITRAGLKGVMPCYCSINGIFTTSSKALLTDLLRGEMGFGGLAVSDYNAVSGLHDGGKLYEDAVHTAYRSMLAGLDVEMPWKNFFGEELKQWFVSGKADIRVLDRAVLRILEAKFRMGLFEQPFALEEEELKKVYYDKRDAEVSLRSALESMVLLKNDGVLPLGKKNGKIAVIGPHAMSAGYFFGGYTHCSMALGSLIVKEEKESDAPMETIPGTPILRCDKPQYEALLKHQKPQCKSLLEMFKDYFGAENVTYAYGYDIAGADTSHYEEALEAAADADVVILTLGGKYGTRKTASMAEGVDATHINLPQCQDEFLEKLEKLGKKTVGIHLDGRPVSSDIADRMLNAILEAWSPSEMGGEAVLQILTGAYNPSGKLPVSVACNAGQIPVYYSMPNASGFCQAGSIGFPDYVDCSHRPRYPFGFGLSYTAFDYDGLELEESQDRILVSARITNSGPTEGTEIVQLYYRDRYATCLRPNMELAGFARVTLKPGEARKVCFTMEYSQTAFLDENMKWKVEAGQFDIMVGASSQDIRLTTGFSIKEDIWVDGRTRAFYADARVCPVKEG